MNSRPRTPCSHVAAPVVPQALLYMHTPQQLSWRLQNDTHHCISVFFFCVYSFFFYCGFRLQAINVFTSMILVHTFCVCIRHFSLVGVGKGYCCLGFFALGAFALSRADSPPHTHIHAYLQRPVKWRNWFTDSWKHFCWNMQHNIYHFKTNCSSFKCKT